MTLECQVKDLFFHPSAYTLYALGWHSANIAWLHSNSPYNPLYQHGLSNVQAPNKMADNFMQYTVQKAHSSKVFPKGPHYLD